MPLLRFLLSGRVQKVKMRRYVESAGRHFNVSGFTINTQDGSVYGEAEASDADAHAECASPLDQFETWLRGEWEPRTFTDVKPTPIGAAYPALAEVNTVVIQKSITASPTLPPEFSTFTMVRDDKHARVLEEDRLCPSPLVPTAETRGWPPRDGASL